MNPTLSPTVDAAAMRKAMGCFATGVAVITTADREGPHGMTVNSLTSVSLDPPLLLVCFTRGTRTADCVTTSSRFAVNILGARQEQLSNTFARRGHDHFEGLDLPVHASGVSLMPGALAHLACAVERTMDGGDHIIVLGRVIDLAHRDGAPLLFYGGSYGDFTDRGHAADFWYC